MNRKEVINRLQLWLLVVNFTIGSALLLVPSGVVVKAKQDGWIAMLFAIAVGAFMQYIMVSLANQHPDKTLIEILEQVLGKYLGKLFGLIYAWFFLHLSALVIRNAVDFIASILMVETPMIVFSIVAGILTLYSALHGLEVFSRTNELFSFFAFIGIVLTTLLLIPLVEFENLQPILATGIKPIFLGAYPVIGFPFAELIVFLMILPFVDKRQHLKKIFVSAGVMGGLVLFLVTISSILVLGTTGTALSIFPTFNMARLINIGNFITRVEAITALAYLFVITTKITVTFYGGSLAISQVFNLQDYRVILIPLIVIEVSLSIILNRNVVEEFNFAVTTWTPYSVLLGVVIPLILLAVGWLKRKLFKK